MKMKYTPLALASAAALAGTAEAQSINNNINAFSTLFDTFAGDAEGYLGSSATLSSGATVSISSPNGSSGWIHNYAGDNLPNPFPGDDKFLGLYGYTAAGQRLPIDVTLTYDFNQTVTGFGLNIIDFGDLPGNSSLVVKASDGTTVYSYTETAGQFDGLETQPGYIGITGGSYTGFTLAVSIDPLTLGSPGHSGNDGIAIDQIKINPVPEPSSAALLGLGGLALILRRRK